jgi:hypothetical protein
MATMKSSKTTKSSGEKARRKLTLSKQTLQDLAPGARAKRIQGGRLPESKGCPKLGPEK